MVGALAVRDDRALNENASARREPSRRRCVVTRRVRPKGALVRFVVGPDDKIVPDVGERLPGRGLWLSADRQTVEAACRTGAFQRAAMTELSVDPDLVGSVDEQLAARALSYLGLARRAGHVSCGREQVRRVLAERGRAILIQAADGAPQARARLRAMAPDAPVVELFTGAELAGALGRDRVVHAAMQDGPLAQRFLSECVRVAGFRPPSESRLPSAE